MNKKPTITIGIPAHNEEANIGNLLKNVLGQKGNFKLERIIVACDGCTDKTAEVVEEATKKKISTTVINDGVRKGKALRLNEIYSIARSDILVGFDADILIQDKYYIEKLVYPIINESVDIVSNRLLPINPHTFIEKVLYVSVCIRNEITEEFKDADNIYTCHGTGKAFTRKFYKNLYLPRIVSEDAYTYLWSKKFGYKYKYTKDAVSYYKLPDNMKDHERQSVRFFQGQEGLKRYFNSKIVVAAHELPLFLTVRKTLKYFFKNPIEVLSYIFIRGLMKLKSFINPKVDVGWQIAKSTRTLS